MENLMRELIRERILQLFTDEERKKAEQMSFEELVDFFYLFKQRLDILNDELKNNKKGGNENDE